MHLQPYTIYGNHCQCGKKQQCEKHVYGIVFAFADINRRSKEIYAHPPVDPEILCLPIIFIFKVSAVKRSEYPPSVSGTFLQHQSACDKLNKKNDIKQYKSNKKLRLRRFQRRLHKMIKALIRVLLLSLDSILYLV